MKIDHVFRECQELSKLELFRLLNSFASNGAYLIADKLCRNLSARFTDPTSLIEIADTYVKMKKPSRALELLSRSENFENTTILKVHYAKICSDMGAPHLASDFLDKLDCSSSSLYFEKAEAFRLRFEYVRALECYEKSITKDQQADDFTKIMSAQMHIKLGNTLLAKRMIAKVLKENPSAENKNVSLAILGESYMRDGRPEKALRFFQKALESQGSLNSRLGPSYLIYAASCFGKLGELKRAVSLFEMAESHIDFGKDMIEEDILLKQKKYELGLIKKSELLTSMSFPLVYKNFFDVEEIDHNQEAKSFGNKDLCQIQINLKNSSCTYQGHLFPKLTKEHRLMAFLKMGGELGVSRFRLIHHFWSDNNFDLAQNELSFKDFLSKVERLYKVKTSQKLNRIYLDDCAERIFVQP